MILKLISILKQILYIQCKNTHVRSEKVLGKNSTNILRNKTVALFGIGGVGSYCFEALVRSGIGNIIIIDKDVIDISNINRQLIADFTNIGESKVDVAEKRARTINPCINIIKYKCFYPQDQDIDLSICDYIIDAIDTVSSKLYLVKKANELNIPIISCMGTGNKIDPTRFEIDDIFNTSMCPLCKVMRHELKKIGINKLKVVYSKEEPIKSHYNGNNTKSRCKSTPGSTSFVPPVAGFIISSEVIKNLLSKE